MKLESALMYSPFQTPTTITVLHHALSWKVDVDSTEVFARCELRVLREPPLPVKGCCEINCL